MTKRLIDFALSAYAAYNAPKFFLMKLAWDQLPDEAFTLAANYAILKVASGLSIMYKNGSWIAIDLGDNAFKHACSVNRLISHG